MRKFLLKKNIYILLAGIIISSGLKAAIYYVSPSGNDNSSGLSPATAWKTIAKVNSIIIQPGNTILFEGGQIFSGGIYIDNNDANDTSKIVTISSYGLGKATISSATSYGLYAYNTQAFTVSNLIFAGSGISSNNSDGVNIYTDLTGNIKLKKIVIKNIEIYNYGKTGLSIGSSHNNTGYKDVLIDSLHVYQIKTNGIVTWGYTSQSHIGWAHQNITIRHTEVNNVTGYSDPNSHRGSGIILGQVDKGLIENSCAHHNGSGNTHCGGPGGIWAFDCNNITIQFCESHHNLHGTGSGCDGLGFDFDGGITNSLMQYNYSHDNDGAGYLLGQYDYARPWSNNVIRYNISENDGRTNAGGITFFKGPGTTMTGAKIYHNTIYVSPSVPNPGVGAITFINWQTGIIDVNIYNNIFQTTGGASFVDIPIGYNAYFAGNLYWPSGGTFKIKYQGIVYGNLPSWRTATGNEISGGNQTGFNLNPLLLNAGNGGAIFPIATDQLNAYKLPNNSPAIDAGLNLMSLFSINAGPRDFFNNIAPLGISPDIGAFESYFNIPLNITIDETNSKNIYKNNNDEISFYPNPVFSGDPVQVKVANLPFSVELTSMAGIRIWKQENINFESFIIPTNNIIKGLYIISIIDSKGQHTLSKLIID